MKRLPLLPVLSVLVACSAAQTREVKVERLGLTLMLIPKVQSELKMTPSQAALVKSEFEAYKKRAQSLFKPGMTLSQRKAKAKELQAVQDKVAVRVLAKFSPKQLARYRQLTLQSEGIWAVLIPEVSRSLKLTPNQISSIRSKRKSFEDKSAALERKRRAEIEAVPEPKDPKNKAQVDAYRARVIAILNRIRPVDRRTIAGWAKEALASAEAVLTAKQRTQWKSMLGPKFDPR